mmetsp:Transcript_33675/g.34165  ORF Transcript_33675/g.34165 Transcript_33675/m.34165 type:complete len:230 (-) Transcript_33675:76-765(-)
MNRDRDIIWKMNRRIINNDDKDAWRLGYYNSPYSPSTYYGIMTNASNTFGTTSYRCCLCKHMKGKEMSPIEREEHKNDHHHKKLLSKVEAEQRKGIGQLMEMENVKYNLNRLGISPPEPIKTLILKSFFEEDPTYMHEAQKLVLDYERLEPLVILELALWKASCLINPPKYVDPINYFARSGWKKTKKTFRHDPLIGIVIPNVISFFTVVDHDPNGEHVRMEMFRNISW